VGETCVLDSFAVLAIKKIRLAHCKKGPLLCAQCREMDVERWCLLDMSPPDQGRVQRRVIQVQVDGRLEWREFEVVRVFDDEQEARAWAEKEGIPFEGESR